MTPAPELSVFVSMAPAPELHFFANVAPAPTPELCCFITWLRLHFGCALLMHFNNFGIHSVFLVASERLIPIYFELILNTATTIRPACVVEVGRSLVLGSRSR